ncbi:MAG: hypothetical protein ACRDWA_05115 [Acidimicrobiia bacterium]
MTADLASIPDQYLANGRYSAALSALSSEFNVADYSVRQAHRRWRAKGWAFSPARGLYVFVPSAHRSRRVVPPLWYIDPMMSHAPGNQCQETIEGKSPNWQAHSSSAT